MAGRRNNSVLQVMRSHAARWVASFVLGTALARLTGCSAVRMSRAVLSATAFDCTILGDNEMGRSVYGVAVGDWNEDGRQDLVFSAAETRILTPYINDGAGKFTRLTPVVTSAVPRGIGVGDIDHDGHLDLSVAHARNNEVYVYVGDGHGGFFKKGRYLTGDSPFDAPLADLDGDGNLDLVIVNESNADQSGLGRVSVLYGKGDGTFGPALDLRAGHYPAHAVIADFDGGNGPDIAVANWDSATVAVWLNDGARQFKLAAEFKTGGDLAYSIAAGDFDRDGRVDLAVTDTRFARVYVFGGNGDGTFSRKQVLSAGTGVRNVVAADLDRDGWLDLITANVFDNTLSVFRGGQGGQFAAADVIPVGRGPRITRVAEFNGDGVPDIVVTNQNGPSATLLLSTPGHGRSCPALEHRDDQSGGDPQAKER